MPTHAEAARVTEAIRTARKAEGELTAERIVTAYAAAHLTDPQKSDSTEYQPGDMLQFFQNAPGHTKGERILIDETSTPPVGLAERFEVYRAKPLPVAVGDRIRITAGGTTKDGKHRLSNGSLFTVDGFTPQGDIKVNNGWIIDRDFGHLAHGYVTTSHASQGTTVSKVFIAIDSESMKATDQRTAYVAITRGKEQALIFTDDHLALLKAVQRGSDGLSATELAEQTSAVKPAPSKPFANRRLGVRNQVMEQTPAASVRTPSQEREHDHAR